MTKVFFSKILDSKIKVEQRLKNIFQAEKIRTIRISPFLNLAIDRLAEFTLRGSSKRIRASLVKIGYEAFGRKAPKSIIDISAAIEIIHSSLLIHDDVIDRDNWRRQGLTIHKYFEKHHHQKFFRSKAKHFGISTAILIGEIGNCLADQLIRQARFSDNRKAQVITYLNQILQETNYGQLLDIYNEARGLVPERDILLVHKLKTARYSFEAPLVLGAILAGTKKDQLRQLSRFAIPAGLAFQIRDDILGIFGNKEQLGKPIDSDIKEGKQTLLYFRALKQLKLNDKKWLINHYGRANITKHQINRIRRLIIASGSLAESQKMVIKYSILAKKALGGSGQNRPKNANILVSLVDYLISRDH